MLKKYIIILFSCFFSFVYAQELQLINIDQAVNMALKESEDYQIQDNEALKSNAQYFQIMSMLFPQIKGDVTWMKNFQYPSDLPTSAFTKNYNIDYGISANQIITTFGRIASSLKGTKKFEQAAKEKQKTIALEVTFATKMMYYNVCFAKRMLEIAKKSYLSTKQNKDFLLQRSYEGRLSKRDNIKINADIAARIPPIASAETNYQNALDTLKKHLGLDLLDEVQLTSTYLENYPEINKEKAFGAMHKNQPILKALRLVIKGQGFLVKSKKAEYFPTVSAFAKYNYKGTSDDNYFIGNNFLRNYGIWGISVNVPLFQGLRRHQEVRKAKLDHKNAYLNLHKMQKQLDIDLEKTLLEYYELLKTLAAHREAVSLAEQSFAMSQELLKSGQISLTDLNDAEMMVTAQQMKYEATLFKLNVALRKIEKLTGNRYSDD